MDARMLADLVVLLEAVRAGSLTRAARRLNTVQSNVTARIKKLEQALGVTLLQRHAHGVAATPAGEEALDVALRIEALLDELRVKYDKGMRHAAKLRIGAIETVAAAHLPSLVVGFSQQHPQVDVCVQTGSSTALLTQLQQRQLDVAFVSRPGSPGSLQTRLALRDELVIAAPPAAQSLRWLEAGRGALKVFVQRLGCSYTQRLLDFLNPTCARPRRVIPLGTLDNVLGLAAAGEGIAALPRAFIAAQRMPRELSLLPMPEDVRQVDIFLVRALDAEAAIAARDFSDYAGERLQA